MERWLIYGIVDLIFGCIVFLPIIITAQRKKKQPPLELYESSFIMNVPRFYFWVGVIGAVFFFLFTVSSLAIVDEIGDLPALLVFMMFALAGTFLSIYSLVWKTVVEIDALTIYVPFLPAQKIKFYEISEVRLNRLGMAVYLNDGKHFTIEKDMTGFDLLKYRFYLIDKLKHAQKVESFFVKMDKQTIVSNTIGMLIFGGIFIALIFSNEERIETYLYISFFGFAACFLFLWLNCLIWKITVSFHSISVRTILGGEKSYLMREITMVYQEKESITIYVKNKKIAKVFSDYRNFSLLTERLVDEGILFYVKGSC